VGDADGDDADGLELFGLEEALFGAFAIGDVGEDEADEGEAVGAVGGGGLEAGEEGGGAGAEEAELEGLGAAGGGEEAAVAVVGVLVVGEDEGGEAAAGEGGAGEAEEGGGGEVGFEDLAFGVEGEVADGGEVVEIEVALAGEFELDLGAAELVVLKFQLDLVDAELVDELREVGRASGEGFARGEAELSFGTITQADREGGGRRSLHGAIPRPFSCQ